MQTVGSKRDDSSKSGVDPQCNIHYLNADILSLTNFCKGLAILWIFLIHYQGGWFGWQGVHIFIVLGGLGLTYSCLNRAELVKWRKWFLKRSRRILPTYWLAIILSLPIVIIIQIAAGASPWATFVKPILRTGLDLFLLTNVFEVFRGGPTGAFWYIPFIFGAYLLFPFLYGWIKDKPTWKRCLSLLAIAVGVEFLYRAIAIYWLDGLPISYDNQRFLWVFPNSLEPLDQHADWLYGFFQRRAPFGFIFSRIGEFVLGMLMAVALVHNRQQTNRRLLNLWMGIAGVIIWLIGQVLLYVGLWSWIFSDFFIALGLTLWVLNFAYFLQRINPNIFRVITFLGIWSYYIYLVHQPFTRGTKEIVNLFINLESIIQTEFLANILYLLVAAICTAIASFLLVRFDTSPLADRMFAPINRLISTSKNLSILPSK
jgi:peptidoglycan/LPS O-acetylase OafA/YrhL